MTNKVLLLLAIVLLASCAANTPAGVECNNPRPDMCPMNYDPVCATRDNALRCVTTPCESTEQKTYGNACSACSDPDVISYLPGACP